MPGDRSECPIADALDIFGDRWTLLVVRDIALKGRRHYTDFLEAGEGIATNVLADRLKVLVQQGICERTRDPENRRRFIYSLTPKGLDLLPMLVEMILWSACYDPQSPVGKAWVGRAKRDREGLLAQLLEAARSPA